MEFSRLIFWKCIFLLSFLNVSFGGRSCALQGFESFKFKIKERRAEMPLLCLWGCPFLIGRELKQQNGGMAQNIGRSEHPALISRKKIN